MGVPRPGDRVADRYELIREIGSGSAGVVFEAGHLHIGRRVALKWLYPHLAADPISAKRFLNEAKAACLIDHPNVIDVFDAGPDRDSLFLVMELLQGEPLSTRMQRGFSSHRDLIDILLVALRGVHAAHRAGIIHRDLKPENIFLARGRPGTSGGPKVLDFGISKLHENRERLTRAGSFVGSPFYMAPEQVIDASTVDARVDIYAIGVLLYEGLSGELPFESESLSELFFRITRKTPALLSEHRPDLPPGLVQAVHRALALDPAQRYPDVTALAAALETYAARERFIPQTQTETDPEVHRDSEFTIPTLPNRSVAVSTTGDHELLDGSATIADANPLFPTDGPQAPASAPRPSLFESAPDTLPLWLGLGLVVLLALAVVSVVGVILTL